MMTKVAVLLLGGLKLAVGPGVFTVLDFHKMDASLIWEELTRVSGLESATQWVKWLWLVLSPPCSTRAPLHFSIDNGNLT
eukprot:433839-Pelagomonas_calceolata.AAC.1